MIIPPGLEAYVYTYAGAAKMKKKKEKGRKKKENKTENAVLTAFVAGMLTERFLNELFRGRI